MGARAALVAAVCAAGLLAGAGSALAEEAKFTFTGAEQEFKVPAGVTSVEVQAIGSEGGTVVNAAPGGAGAIVTGKLSVKPAQVLYVEVGGVPFNGGGPSLGLSPGSKGGGASDVRTMSIGAEPSPGDEASLNSRLLVAAGGGGGGFKNFDGLDKTCAGGPGGGAGEKGVDGTSCGFPGGGGGGAGEAGKGGAGGAGFTFSTPDPSVAGNTGLLGSGGEGGGGFGGGGGGGRFGGGGGGAQDVEFHNPPLEENNAGNGGGGGGSNLVPEGGEAKLAKFGVAASVTFTYTASANALAAILVSHSIGQGPGHALADKAAAIQAAVNAGQTAIACSDITEYLGLVKAQTGKKLTETQASELTTDATNLAAALGC
jgi:hypothetical protein